MQLVLNLPPELETALSVEAARLGLPLSEYALRLVLAGRQSRPPLRSGSELLNYWQQEQLVATKPEIVDSSAHARKLRAEAEARSRA
jgi:hypothetical protein